MKICYIHYGILYFLINTYCDIQLIVIIKGEWDTSILWRASFQNKQWKWLFIYNSSYLDHIC